MKVKRIVVRAVAVVVLMALAAVAVPVAADKGPPGPAGLHPVHMVLEPGTPETIPPPDEGKSGASQPGVPPVEGKGPPGPAGVHPVHMVLEPGTPETILPLDEGKAESSEACAPTAMPEGWHLYMCEGFEGIWPGTGWRVTGNPTWDDTSYRAYYGSWSAYCADSSVSPPGPYPPNMAAWMVYGPFSLSCAWDARMDLYYWLDSEASYDSLGWLASIDGHNFYGHGDWGRYKTWQLATLDLDNVPTLGNLCGQSKVWVAIAFSSDASVQYEGAYVDDVCVWRWNPYGDIDHVPSVGTVSPSSGSAPAGQMKYFTTSWSDPDGYADLKWCMFHVGANTAQANNVFLNYNVATNKIMIRSNDGSTWWGGKLVGSNNIIQNNQATVYCANTSVSKSGNTIQVTWAIAFKSAFKGNKKTYLKVQDVCDNIAGWTQKGTWTIQ